MIPRAHQILELRLGYGPVFKFPCFNTRGFMIKYSGEDYVESISVL